MDNGLVGHERTLLVKMKQKSIEYIGGSTVYPPPSISVMQSIIRSSSSERDSVSVKEQWDVRTADVRCSRAFIIGFSNSVALGTTNCDILSRPISN